ncbi:hypothetical protein [Clostridium senegalense]|uniref:hypothetical protein n=1 Tax=Clostridium senegalense TaxID=1465809 RepID=UPI000289D9B2|nr:hypothetical protein [Clostridium senegalense]
MKIKRILLFTMMMLLITIPASGKIPETILIGEVQEVKQEGNYTRLLVEGYLKGCEVYKETVVVIVSEDTKILKPCKKELNKIVFDKGDTVYVELSPAMTKSIPPQSSAIKIQLTKK